MSEGVGVWVHGSVNSTFLIRVGATKSLIERSVSDFKSIPMLFWHANVGILRMARIVFKFRDGPVAMPNLLHYFPVFQQKQKLTKFRWYGMVWYGRVG